MTDTRILMAKLDARVARLAEVDVELARLGRENKAIKAENTRLAAEIEKMKEKL